MARTSLSLPMIGGEQEEGAAISPDFSSRAGCFSD
jgi:hypothetical protein